MTTLHPKLDNPVWHSLIEVHSELATGNEHIQFYRPEYCPFGGFASIGQAAAGAQAYSRLTDTFFIVGEKPLFHDPLTLKRELVCNQMVQENEMMTEISEDLIELQVKYREELFQLVNLVQPGYFKKRTCELGRYFGIFKDHQLIAVAGERMKMNSYTEVSAVVTHPDHTGKGYARQLVAHVSDLVRSENKIPYLHVVETNTNAVRLYEKLGFVTRRKISFWNLVLQP